MSTRGIHARVAMLLFVALPIFAMGCSEDASRDSNPLGPQAAGSISEDFQVGDTPPAELATVNVGGESLTFWPYTGKGFDGVGQDPINLVFQGKADPLQIRAALMSLDGDRSAFGLPPVPPFNLRWTDIIGGDVQTAYADGPIGWTGSVMQLTLGEFGPVRIHLRLFRARPQADGSGAWTLGGAHFEVQIPGTADHQVLSWELAEQIVMIDLMRSGLLAASGPVSSGVISATPSFRTIPAVIYNGLPPSLVAAIGGPAQPVSADVPIASDGRAKMFPLIGEVPIVPGTWPHSISLAYNQIVPKPFCVTGPGSYLRIVGPVTYTTQVTVSATGRYTYTADYSADLEVTPIDLSGGTPVPAGSPTNARVEGQHQGILQQGFGRITARDHRIVLDEGGPQKLFTDLHVPESGQRTYHLLEGCIGSD